MGEREGRGGGREERRRNGDGNEGERMETKRKVKRGCKWYWVRVENGENLFLM